jgi:hypothetical protein
MRVRIEVVDDDGRTYAGEIELSTGKPSQLMKEKTVSVIGAKKSTLMDQILSLRSTNFFSSPRVAQEVHQEVTKRYYCTLNRVQVALTRAQQGKKLRRANKVFDGKTLTAYVW